MDWESITKAITAIVHIAESNCSHQGKHITMAPSSLAMGASTSPGVSSAMTIVIAH